MRRYVDALGQHKVFWGKALMKSKAFLDNVDDGTDGINQDSENAKPFYQFAVKINAHDIKFYSYHYFLAILDRKRDRIKSKKDKLF